MQQAYTSPHLQYLLYLPKSYNAVEKWPLILFLHGSGERGADPHFTVYDGLTYGQSTDTTYRDEQIYNWFLTHVR